MKRLFTVMMMALAGSSAFAQWNTNATPTCLMGIEYTDPETGEVRKGGDYYICSPKVARTPDKKTWISWKTLGHKKIRDINRYAVRTYLQLLDRDGNPQFEEPIMVNDHMTDSWWSDYALLVAADGSAIVTIADQRFQEATIADSYTYTQPVYDEEGNALYDEEGNLIEEEVTGVLDHGDHSWPSIYKIDQEGNFLWGLDGMEFPEYDNTMYTNAFVVGDDTYFVFVNTDYESTVSTGYIQRITDDGVTVWEEPKVLECTNPLQVVVLPTNDDEILLFDTTNEGSRVQRTTRDLEPVWGEPVIYDEHAYGGYEMNHYDILPDGSGGACIAFQRFMGNTSHNIRAQHVYEDGSLGFGLTGLDAYNADAYDHAYQSLAVNPETEEMLVQFASELGSTGNVMHQKFSFDGEYLYDELGMSIASKNKYTNTYMFGLVGVGSLKCGDWIAVYRDLAAYNHESFVIRRYDQNGERVWTRTIGRDLAPDGVKLVVEEEAAYLFYREYAEGKEPGFKIFRIGVDGSYDVSYPEPEIPNGIENNICKPTTANRYFTVDGRQIAQPQRGLNIVKQGDGSVRKFAVE